MIKNTHTASSFIAILGGSFDPIHNGHLALAKSVIQHIQHAAVYFVPCGNPVHRPPFNTPAKHRINMVKCAIKDYTPFHLETYEVDHPHLSYTRKTLHYFRKLFPDTPIGFIMGMDTFLALDTAWGTQWKEILHDTHLLIAPRAGIREEPASSLQDFLQKHRIIDENLLHKSLNGCIMMLPVAPQSVSSTEIRKKIATHDDVSSLIPKAVYDYIQQHKLYL